MRTFLFVIAILSTSIMHAQHWETNWQQATEKAKKADHNLILVFSGSDWCGPCIKLDKSIWQSTEFQEYAKDHWIMVRADFPRKKGNKLSDEKATENAQLAEKYNQNGYFPLVLVLSPEGKILGTTGYKNISAKEYIDLLKKFEG
ncbi:MAG: thioredoxin family protein [Maribacter sp.]|nr:thioredoxin family protein [Maribacter sp.]